MAEAKIANSSISAVQDRFVSYTNQHLKSRPLNNGQSGQSESSSSIETNQAALEELMFAMGRANKMAQNESNASNNPTQGGGEPPMDKTVSEIDKRLVAVETALPGLSTKQDIADLKNDTNKAVGDVLIAINGLTSKLDSFDTKLDITKIQQSVEKSHTDIYKWVATIIISVAGIGFAAYSGLKASGTGQPSQSAPPMIIQVPTVPAAPTAAPVTPQAGASKGP